MHDTDEIIQLYTRAEALAALATYEGDEIIEPAEGIRLAAPFGARPPICQPDSEIGQRHVAVRHLADAIIDATGMRVPFSIGNKRYFRNMVAALRGEPTDPPLE